ncbi:flippase-like domain-containing protein [Candidatus Micrarchaeota archaeon]|nr:flippase-like domain-containing protein [Candidatus Micrarchaeota archaeon]
MRNRHSHPKQHLARWLLLFIGWLVAFALVLSWLGGSELAGQVSRVNLTLVGAAILFLFGAYVVSLVNWAVFVRASGINTRFGVLAQMLAAGLFVDHVLPPIAPGGELTMGYLLSRQSRKPFSKTFATVTIHSVTWLVSFMAFTFLLLVYLLYQGNISRDLTLLFMLLLIGFGFLLWFVVHLALAPRLCKRIACGAVSRLFPAVSLLSGGKLRKRQLLAWVGSTVDAFSKSFSVFLHQRGLVWASCGLMVFHHFFIALSFFFVLAAFGVPLSPTLAMAIYMFISLVSLLSFVPGQLGVYEVTGVILVTLAGGTQAGLVALAIGVVRLIHYWAVIFVGGFFALKLGMEKLVLVRP